MLVHYLILLSAITFDTSLTHRIYFEPATFQFDMKERKAPFIFSPYTRWIAPILTVTSEQYSISTMLGRSVGNYENLLYIEPNFRSIESLSYSRRHRYPIDFFPELSRSSIGLGLGYRHLIYPNWILGSYIYWDYSFNFSKNPHVSVPDDGSLHTINVGIENRFSWGEIISNVYWNHAYRYDISRGATHDVLVTSILSPGMHVDTKVSLWLPYHFTLSMEPTTKNRI